MRSAGRGTITATRASGERRNGKAPVLSRTRVTERAASS